MYGAFVSLLINVKLLEVPLPCKGTLTIGDAAAPNTFIPNRALPKSDEGFIVPNE